MLLLEAMLKEQRSAICRIIVATMHLLLSLNKQNGIVDDHRQHIKARTRLDSISMSGVEGWKHETMKLLQGNKWDSTKNNARTPNSLAQRPRNLVPHIGSLNLFSCRSLVASRAWCFYFTALMLRLFFNTNTTWSAPTMRMAGRITSSCSPCRP